MVGAQNGYRGGVGGDGGGGGGEGGKSTLPRYKVKFT